MTRFERVVTHHSASFDARSRASPIDNATLLARASV
jgi:hypothetical protein